MCPVLAGKPGLYLTWTKLVLDMAARSLLIVTNLRIGLKLQRYDLMFFLIVCKSMFRVHRRPRGCVKKVTTRPPSPPTSTPQTLKPPLKILKY